MSNTWDKQQDEKPTPYTYFLQFLEFQGNSITEFHRYLEKIQTPGTRTRKMETIQKYARENNWINRKNDYIAHRNQEQFNRLLDKEFEVKEKHFNKKVEAVDKMLTALLFALDNDGINGYQANMWSNAIKTLKDDNRLDIEQPTVINSTDLKAEVDAEITPTESIFDIVDKELGLTDDAECQKSQD